MLKRKGQSSTSVLLGNLKKSDPFFPQANLSSIQVAFGTAAAAHMVAFLLIVALQASSGTAAATEHMRVDEFLLHVTFSAFGTVLLITFVSVKGLPVAALKSALTVFKAVLSSSSSRAAAHICGHVLGLRIAKAARIVEMTVRARHALESQWEAGHRLASSPAVGTGEQATGRVDVPGEAYTELYMQKVAAKQLLCLKGMVVVWTSWKETAYRFQFLCETSLAKHCLSRFPAKLLVVSCPLLSLVLRAFLLISFI